MKEKLLKDKHLEGNFDPDTQTYKKQTHEIQTNEKQTHEIQTHEKKTRNTNSREKKPEI